MKKICLAIVAAASLGACAPQGTSYFFLDRKTPSQFTPEELVFFENQFYMTYCQQILAKRAIYTMADRSIASAGLKNRGMSSREIEIILDPTLAYGTGMTFKGLSCSLGYEPQTNRSFYQGVGHRWQAVTGNGYVYLEGDGTERGMRVTSWN